MKCIPLTKGMETIVDDDDFQNVAAYKWFSNRSYKNKFIACAKINGKPVKLHRFILNAIDGLQVDHVNGNTLDNRRSNLRICTNAQNQFNSKKISNTSSKFKGVHKRGNRWVASIRRNYILINIGSFVNEIDAALAYNEYAKKIFGDFANLNKLGCNHG